MVPGPPHPPQEGSPIQHPLGQAGQCPGKSRCVPVGPVVTQISRNASLAQPLSPPCQNTSLSCHQLPSQPLQSPEVPVNPGRMSPPTRSATLSPATCPELEHQPKPGPQLSMCLPIVDSGQVLLGLLEMSMCSSLSSSPHHGAETPQPTPRSRWEGGDGRGLGR